MSNDNQWNHPKIGERVRLCCPPNNGNMFGEFIRKNPPWPVPKDELVRWIRGGDEGEVIRVIQGYASHRCPNHLMNDNLLDEDECVCAGNEDGIVNAMMQSPVVAWESQEGGTVERCLSPEDERRDGYAMTSSSWERVQ